MPSSAGTPSRDVAVVRGLAIAVVAAGWLHVVGAVIDGIGAAGSRFEEAPSGLHVGLTLSAFGLAGDAGGLLFALTATALVVWWLRMDDTDGGWLRLATAALLVATGIGLVLGGIGSGLVNTDVQFLWERFFTSVGFALAGLVVVIAAFVALRVLAVSSYDIDDVVDVEEVDGEAIDAVVFAVDRGNGDVRAFFSYAEAARRIHVYSVEEQEYAFFTDTGEVVEASVRDEHIVFRPTGRQAQDELMAHLRGFVQRRGIDVAGEADKPWAYAAPISQWQWLQLWPGWMRWMGRLVRW
ncbi:MAG: hypothetical protein JO222_02525 [Frankiales bacterium]|nr:hypothetical protein [Frankiales bacterium]